MLYENDKKVRKEVHAFMVQSHQGHKRCGGTPYYYHPWWTAKIVELYAISHFKSVDTLILPPAQTQINDMYLAGLLHDTIEDCGVTFEEVAREANMQVADLVAHVSADHRLPLPKRKVAYENRLGHAPFQAKLLKLADITHNLQTSYELIKEKPELAEPFLKGWPATVLMYIESIRVINTTINAPEWRWARDAALTLESICASWSRRDKIAASDWPGTAPVLRKFRRKRNRQRKKKTA